MSRKYSVRIFDTNTVDTTIGGITSAATIRPKIYDVLIGSDATPADQAVQYSFERYTAAGTSTAVTPQALDPADPSALASAGRAHTVEPTYTANALLLNLPVNQRASFRWVASPGGELIAPATAANGIGVLGRVVTSAYNTVITLHYAE